MNSRLQALPLSPSCSTAAAERHTAERKRERETKRVCGIRVSAQLLMNPRCSLRHSLGFAAVGPWVGAANSDLHWRGDVGLPCCLISRFV